MRDDGNTVRFCATKVDTRGVISKSVEAARAESNNEKQGDEKPKRGCKESGMLAVVQL